MILPEINFSIWKHWEDRNSLPNINLPGVYILAHFDELPPGSANTLEKNIIYIGETCDQTLRDRLNAFNRCGFNGKDGHSGGKTYWDLYQGKARDNLFVSVFPIPSGYGNLRPLYIRFVERKLILDYALKWGFSPEINKK